MNRTLTILIRNDGKNVAFGMYLRPTSTNEVIRLTHLMLQTYWRHLYYGSLCYTDEDMAIDMFQTTNGNGPFDIDINLNVMVFTNPDTINDYLKDRTPEVIMDIGKEEIDFEACESFTAETYISAFGKHYFEYFKKNNKGLDIWDLEHLPFKQFQNFRDFVVAHPDGAYFDDNKIITWIK